MKVDRTKAVALLVALGFAKAGDWDDAKLLQRVQQVPEKVAADKIPEDFKSLYNALAEAVPNQESIELSGDAAPKAKPAKSATKPTKATAAVKAKSAGSKKPAKKSKPAKKEIEDDFVGREGSKSANVRAQVTKTWQSDEEIQAKCGETLTNTRLRLYHAVKAGTVEVRKRIEYRRVPSGKDQ